MCVDLNQGVHVMDLSEESKEAFSRQRPSGWSQDIPLQSPNVIPFTRVLYSENSSLPLSFSFPINFPPLWPWILGIP